MYFQSKNPATAETLYCTIYISSLVNFFFIRELEDRLHKQKATQRYIEEFKTKRQEVCGQPCCVCTACLFD